MDPDPGGPKTCGYGSGSLASSYTFITLARRIFLLTSRWERAGGGEGDACAEESQLRAGRTEGQIQTGNLLILWNYGLFHCYALGETVQWSWSCLVLHRLKDDRIEKSVNLDLAEELPMAPLGPLRECLCIQLCSTPPSWLQFSLQLGVSHQFSSVTMSVQSDLHPHGSGFICLVHPYLNSREPNWRPN